MNYVRLSGYVYSVVDNSNYVLAVDDEFIHCRSSRPPVIGEELTVTGSIRSSIGYYRGRKFVEHYIDTK